MKKYSLMTNEQIVDNIKRIINKKGEETISLDLIYSIVDKELAKNNYKLPNYMVSEFYPTNDSNECKIEITPEYIKLAFLDESFVVKKTLSFLPHYEYTEDFQSLFTKDKIAASTVAKFINLSACPEWLIKIVKDNKEKERKQQEYCEKMNKIESREDVIPISIIIKLMRMISQKQEDVINIIKEYFYENIAGIADVAFDANNNILNITYSYDFINDNDDVTDKTISLKIENDEFIFSGIDSLKKTNIYIGLKERMLKCFEGLYNLKKFKNVCGSIKVLEHDNFNISIDNNDFILKMNDYNPDYVQPPYYFRGNGSVSLENNQLFISYDKEIYDEKYDGMKLSKILRNTFVSINDCPKAFQEELKNIKKTNQEADNNPDCYDSYTLSHNINDDYYDKIFCSDIKMLKQDELNDDDFNDNIDNDNFDENIDNDNFDINDNSMSCIISDKEQNDFSYISLEDLLKYLPDKELLKKIYLKIDKLPNEEKSKIITKRNDEYDKQESLKVKKLNLK